MIDNLISIAVYTASSREDRILTAKHLAQKLHLPFFLSMPNNLSVGPFLTKTAGYIPNQDFHYFLVVTDHRIELQANHTRFKPISVDFLDSAYQKRLSLANPHHELILKAVGVKPNLTLSVIDATAGLGEDAFLLATLGCQVHCLERSGIIAALLEDGISRLLAMQPNLNTQFSWEHADAIDYLTQLTEAQCPHVIYVDPMFPHRRKSAGIRKEMQVLRALVGDDQDDVALLFIALQKAKQRVVVKRSRLAPAISGNRAPDWVIVGKSSRFDVYSTLSHSHSKHGMAALF